MAVILRDVWALLAGFAVLTGVVLAFTWLLAKLVPGFADPSLRSRPQYVLANLAYSFAGALAGGYVTVWIASGNPLTKVLMLAIVVLAISAISILESRGRRAIGPQLTGAVLSAAGVVLGGFLRLRLLGLRW